MPAAEGEEFRQHVVNEDRFAPIPEALLYDTQIAADAVRVFGVLRRHGDDPENCYPSQARIAKLIGRSQRSINGWLRQLEDAGWIERITRYTPAGDLDSNGYRVFMVARAGERAVRAGERGPVRAGERGESALGSAVNESQLNESQEEREARAPVPLFAGFELGGDDDPYFAAFWKAYPRKVDKGSARKAWRAAVKLVAKRAKGFPPESGAERIVERTAAFAADPNLPPAEFIPHPATWLRGERWNDGPLPARNVTGGRSQSDRSSDWAQLGAELREAGR